MKNLLLLFLYLTLFLFASGQKPSTPNTGADDSFSFVFMTDIHLYNGKNAIKWFHRVIDDVNKLNPDFVLTGGDNIADALSQNWEKADTLYRLYNSMIKEFNMPVYNTLGNHDVFGLYKVSGVSPDDPEYGKGMYQKREGSLYYSFDYKNWHFIVLDGVGLTDDRQFIGLVDSTQIEWLKADLEKVGKKRPVVISIHIPLITVGQVLVAMERDELSSLSVVANARSVVKILEQYNVKLVLQGHSHTLEDVYYNGIHYIIGGAVCGRRFYGNNLKSGFVKVDVDGEDFTWKYIDY